MANFRESAKALKEAGLADPGILKIMSDSVDGKMNEFPSIPKTNSKNSLYESRRDLPQNNTNINAETATQKAC